MPDITINKPRAGLRELLLQLAVPPLMGLRYIPFLTWMLMSASLWLGHAPIWFKLLFTFTVNIMLSMLWPLVWLYWCSGFCLDDCGPCEFRKEMSCLSLF